ncbi:protein BTG3-like isoform X2 [Agrilus planipennis]|uniref:Protein BTG3-like isoform X2 n=1 Tax=Agrilus planipennis TaxID=224129 RepID=A0A1W4XLC3_AGRPL|nr:protein BTG3-like isoform X2 [Agrilus planipennis]
MVVRWSVLCCSDLVNNIFVILFEYFQGFTLFEKHWFPELPARGQGYRCIRVNGLTPVDQSLEQAASKCGLSYNDLSLPTELTVWVDPSEVCYR